MKTLGWTFVVFALSLSISACHHKAQGSDAGVTSADAGPDYGPLGAPLAVRKSEVSIGEESVMSLREVEEKARPLRLDELFNRLKNKRLVWRELNPGRSFPGNSILSVTDDVTVAQFKSVFLTAAFAGYRSAEILPGDPKRHPRCKWQLDAHVVMFGEIDQAPKDMRLHIHVDRTEIKFRWVLSDSLTQNDSMRATDKAEDIAEALLVQWKLQGLHRDRRDLATDVCKLHIDDLLTFSEIVPLLDALCMNDREIEGLAGKRRVPIFTAVMGTN